MNNFRNICSEYMAQGLYDFWTLSQDKRYEVIAEWLKDRFFTKTGKAIKLESFEIISESSVSDKLPLLLIQIALGEKDKECLADALLKSLEADYGHKIAVDFDTIINTLKHEKNRESGKYNHSYAREVSAFMRGENPNA